MISRNKIKRLKITKKERKVFLNTSPGKIFFAMQAELPFKYRVETQPSQENNLFRDKIFQNQLKKYHAASV